MGTPEIAAEAGVTRGAMYHQFADKAALFGEVVEAVEQDVMTRMATSVTTSGRPRPPTRSVLPSMPGWRCLAIQRCVS
ncbi:bacterial regulatory s, tetR family protein [Mycobacterium ulcerans str. Harvey]|uniref:Bacterial regulatory s, tetR family protein n=1 Tax=Mycobacterium ulcerans str. Harvey TaxID=1299332 RepID=A0ABN0QTS2_MYCUL|nr:bacterial regulatory s, tetR family protein [Mycobacterium ulcerans str. Harvey]